MRQLTTLIATLTLVMLIGCSAEQTPEPPAPPPPPTNVVQLSSEIDWEQLNPARGDASPQAGTVWGDRKGEVPTGFLAKFVDGFSSPPHLHNVTYRAVVIKGAIHNDDPQAANMWMQPGSFWTQPKGEVHITSAKGDENIAYVEIDHGPYLVKPVEEAFETEEQPVNVDASNVVWLSSDESKWIADNNGAAISFLWEDKANELRGVFVQLPNGFNGQLHSDGSIFHAVVIAGEPTYFLPPDSTQMALDPGSYFTAEGTSTHPITNAGQEKTLLYIRTNGTVRVD